MLSKFSSKQKIYLFLATFALCAVVCYFTPTDEEKCESLVKQYIIALYTDDIDTMKQICSESKYEQVAEMMSEQSHISDIEELNSELGDTDIASTITLDEVELYSDSEDPVAFVNMRVNCGEFSKTFREKCIKLDNEEWIITKKSFKDRVYEHNANFLKLIP